MEHYQPLPTEPSERRKVQNRNAQRNFRKRRHRLQVNQASQPHGTSSPAYPLSWPLLYDGQGLAPSTSSSHPQQSHVPVPQFDLSLLSQQPPALSLSSYGTGTMPISENTANQEYDTVRPNSASEAEPMATSYLSSLDSVSPMLEYEVTPASTMPTMAFPIAPGDSSNPPTAISIAESGSIGPVASHLHATQALHSTSLPPPGSNPQGDFSANGHHQSKASPPAPEQSPDTQASSPDRPDSESNNSSSNSSNHGTPANNNPTDHEVTKHNDTVSVLHIASHRGHTAILSILLAHNLDPNEPDGSGRPPLHLAAINGHTTITSLLLSHGACINAVDTLGRTALHWAVLRGHEAIVKIFLDVGGADLNLQDHNGWSVLHVAVERGSEATLRMLLNQGADLKLKARKCQGWKTGEKAAEDESSRERVETEG